MGNQRDGEWLLQCSPRARFRKSFYFARLTSLARKSDLFQDSSEGALAASSVTKLFRPEEDDQKLSAALDIFRDRVL